MTAVRHPPDDDPRPPFAPSSVQPDLDLDASLPVSGNRLAVGLRLDEYEISGVLGEGGFGIVYLVWDHSLQRRLAIKEYMPSSIAWRGRDMRVQFKDPRYAESFEAGLRSFINEAKLLASFDHPSLIKVHRFFQAHGTAYMVMPFYEGITLKQALLSSDRAPDERWIRELLQPLLAALEYMHGASCYHRDIAPDNILLVDEGRPLLLDFGAARRVIGDMTKAVTVILKPGYAPIEQYGDMPGIGQGPWTDIYALGAVLHFAITGVVPRASVTRLVADDYVPLAQRMAGRYGDRLLKAIDRMLVVQPQGRPQTIGELRALMDIELSQDSGRIVLPSRMAPDAEPWTRPATRSQPGAAASLPLPMPAVKGGKPTKAAQTLPPTVKQRALPATPRGPMRLPQLSPRLLLIGIGAVLLVLFALGVWRQLANDRGSAPAPTPEPPASSPALEAPAPAPVASEPAALPPPAEAASAVVTPAGPVAEPVAESVAASAPAAAASAPAPVASPPMPAASTTVHAVPPPAAAPPVVHVPKPPHRVEPAPRATEPSPAAPSASPRISSNARCADIIQRVSIGETLTAADRRILKEECGK
ncbi:serine/threonine protein kinase [Aquabacterium sp.]|uniref:serine/threonine protein kinase n=1 Tax=Aquabacterium sp. TaxID=1872578 RepID=UPI003784C4F6